MKSALVITINRQDARCNAAELLKRLAVCGRSEVGDLGNGGLPQFWDAITSAELPNHQDQHSDQASGGHRRQ